MLCAVRGPAARVTLDEMSGDGGQLYLLHSGSGLDVRRSAHPADAAGYR